MTHKGTVKIDKTRNLVLVIEDESKLPKELFNTHLMRVDHKGNLVCDMSVYGENYILHDGKKVQGFIFDKDDFFIEKVGN